MIRILLRKLFTIVLVLGTASRTGLATDGDFSTNDHEAAAKTLLARMTLAEKVGQMTQADLAGLSSIDEISELSLGSVLSGGDSDPANGNLPENWRDTVLECQAQAAKSRLGVPLIYGIDAVHGHNNVLGAIIYPHNIGLGCANDPELVERIGSATARAVRATGMHWAFAPCVTVPRDDRWGRTYEGYSEDPKVAGALGAALVRGLQGDLLKHPESVLACAKHWVGDGGTTAEIRTSKFKNGIGLCLDQGDTKCDEAELRRVHVTPYLPCLEAGVGSIMVSYNSWNGVKCTARRDLITDLLKRELGFDGIVVSDYNAIDQCHDDYKTAIGLAINAGVDMAMVSKSQREFVSHLVSLVEEGTIDQSRIDDAVLRILRVKSAMGLLDPQPISLKEADLAAVIGASRHRAVAREAVAKSLVVLKNESQMLPLGAATAKIAVVGNAADDMGMQCGGWTIDWQGKPGQVTTGGTTLLQGIRHVAGEDCQVTFSPDGSKVAGNDIAIVVVAEEPYAEGTGDRESLELRPEDQSVVDRVLKAEVPVCLVVLSGRPVELGNAIQCDAIVAAWLPGTEGGGVADVLFGEVPATGRLSFSWPEFSNQQPVNLGDNDYAPLYRLGYGLTPFRPVDKSDEVANPRQASSLEFVKGHTWGWDGRRGSYQSAEAAESMAKMADLGVDHICLAFSAEMATPHSTDFTWGDGSKTMVSDDDIRHAISLARQHNLKVVLKPTVNCADGTWRAWINFYRDLTNVEIAQGLTGVMDPWGSEPKFRAGQTVDLEAWGQWWGNYQEFLLHYARLAAEEEVAVLCLGCEMNSSESFEAEWRETIQSVRKVFPGHLTYNCNHGRESTIKWWDDLDVIGVSGYYPTPPPEGVTLKEAASRLTPKADIVAALQPVKRELAKLTRELSKPVLFIETGVTNVQGASRYPWTHPTDALESPINDQEQVHYYEAMLEVFWGEPWCLGFCWWDWPTKLYSKDEAAQVRSFCTYGRPAEQTLREWYFQQRNYEFRPSDSSAD